MTVKEKNVEIAKMIEWDYNELSESFDTPFLERVEIQAFGDEQFSSSLRDYELKFHSDANWQFEALNFITTLDLSHLHYTWEMGGQEYNNFSGFDYNIQNNACQIILNLQLDECRDIIQTTGKDTKEAIFEALYQFSQYLKQKK